MKPKRPSQRERLVDWLRANPGSSSLDMIGALRIVNTTARISEARQRGHNIVCQRDKAGIDRYHLLENEQQPLGLEMPLDDPKESHVLTAFVGIGGLAYLFWVSGMVAG